MLRETTMKGSEVGKGDDKTYVSWVSSDVLNCFVDGDSSTEDRCGCRHVVSERG